MKHKCFAAVVLAAALLLTGCGGAAAPAAPAGSGAASQSAAAPAVQTAQKERITDQWSLEKTVQGEMIGVQKLSIHVPQFVCDSPDAAALNEELAAMYVAEYKDYESYPDAEVPQGEESPQTEIINWDAYWYGDCVSLVMRSHDYEDAPWYYSGWCFDFATGRRITTAEMLQHMGLDPDEVQAQMQRQAMQTFDREMAQGAYYEGLRSGGNLSEMRILYVLETFDVYCYDLNSSDPEEPGDALDYWGRCYSSKDRDLTVLYRTNSAPVLVQDGEYTELTLEGDNEMGPFYSMSSLNLSGDELLTVGELESNGDDYFAAFDLDGNELARSSQPVGSFNAVMMKRPNGYLLDTGYMWELYAPDGTFLEKSFPVGERETLCQLCGDFCTFDVFLPLEENAFLAVGHHGKATEPDEPVVFRITTDF